MPSPSAKKSKPTRDADAEPADGPVFYPPLRPNRKLLLISAIVLAAWVIGLLVIYFTSIKPMRQPATPAADAKPPASVTVPAGPAKAAPTTQG
ncbi:MAG TPA: hypothetical protein VF796_27835 [Humisphaera sp.]